VEKFFDREDALKILKDAIKFYSEKRSELLKT